MQLTLFAVPYDPFSGRRGQPAPSRAADHRSSLRRGHGRRSEDGFASHSRSRSSGQQFTIRSAGIRARRACAESGLGIGELRGGVRIAVECEETPDRQGVAPPTSVMGDPAGRDRHQFRSRRVGSEPPQRTPPANRRSHPRAEIPVIRPRGCARIKRTEGWATAASMRWSIAESSLLRNRECGAAKTTSKEGCLVVGEI